LMEPQSGQYCYDYPRPAVSVDAVVFAMVESVMKVLLIRREHDPFAGSWALPGGFVDENECLETAARRELAEETSLTNIFLEQLYSFGDPGRDPRGRTVTVAYMALIPEDEITQVAHGDNAADAQWLPVDQLPKLAFDHDKIIRFALERLKGKVRYTTVAFHLLGEEFTFGQLRCVYETIWQRDLDRRNFRKWIHNLDIIEETGRQRCNGYRPAQLYRLKAGSTDRYEIIKSSVRR